MDCSGIIDRILDQPVSSLSLVHLPRLVRLMCDLSRIPYHRRQISLLLIHTSNSQPGHRHPRPLAEAEPKTFFRPILPCSIYLTHQFSFQDLLVKAYHTPNRRKTNSISVASVEGFSIPRNSTSLKRNQPISHSFPAIRNPIPSNNAYIFIVKKN